MEQLSILQDSLESTLRYTLIQTLGITKTTKTLCVSIMSFPVFSDNIFPVHFLVR